jgi:hypothetical protein
MHLVWGLTFVVVHLIFWFLITVIESFESRTGRIPMRRPWSESSPFPYFCDWHTATWGDLVGLSLIDWSAGYAFSFTFPNAALIAILVATIGTVGFHLRCISKRHRPDSGYPFPGKISLQGRTHVVYFFLQLFVCTLVLLFAVEGKLPVTPLITALAGGAVYIASFMFDWYAGHFALLRV